MEYINTNKIKDFRNLDCNDFYIITDFDHTLTTPQSDASFGVIPKFLGGKILEERTRIYKYYRPLELDYSIEEKEKQRIMREWAKSSFKLLTKYVTKEMIYESVKNADLYLRGGTKQFLEEMNINNIPVIVMSSGLGNIIEAFLEKENCLFKNIKIISNFLNFDKEKVNIDFKNIMATSNKEFLRIPQEIRENIQLKKRAILFGDLIEDIKMANKDELSNILTIGFLDDNIKHNLERYNSNFDIVLTNNSNFKDVKYLIK